MATNRPSPEVVRQVAPLLRLMVENHRKRQAQERAAAGATASQGEAAQAGGVVPAGDFSPRDAA